MSVFLAGVAVEGDRPQFICHVGAEPAVVRLLATGAYGDTAAVLQRWTGAGSEPRYLLGAFPPVFSAWLQAAPALLVPSAAG